MIVSEDFKWEKQCSQCCKESKQVVGYDQTQFRSKETIIQSVASETTLWRDMHSFITAPLGGNAGSGSAGTYLRYAPLQLQMPHPYTVVQQQIPPNVICNNMMEYWLQPPTYLAPVNVPHGYSQYSHNMPI